MKIRYITLNIVACLFLSSCSLIKPVSITEIGNFKTITSGSDPKIKFDAGIKNPNRFGVTVQKMNIGLSYGGPAVATISIMENTRIKGNSDMVLPVELSPSIKDISEIFSSGVGSFISGSTRPDFEIQGEIVIRKFIFRKRYNIKESIRF